MLTSRLPLVIIASSSGVEGCLDVYAIALSAPKLSSEDVSRIASEVVNILRGTPSSSHTLLFTLPFNFRVNRKHVTR